SDVCSSDLDPAHPNSRIELARLIEGLDAAGADKIFLDVIIQRSSSRDADEMLAAAIERSRAHLVQRFRNTPFGPRMMANSPEIGGFSSRIGGRVPGKPHAYIEVAAM